jgi:hypothetical protein
MDVFNLDDHFRIPYMDDGVDTVDMTDEEGLFHLDFSISPRDGQIMDTWEYMTC